ncbi:MAG: diacylglyceryl transferase, partial [Rhodobacteraceae bacterium]
MSAAELYLSSDSLHPIDMVETLAEHHAWDFDRMNEDQIAM